MVFAIEINLGEGLGELGLADAGGAEEKEGADGAASVLDAGSGTTQGARYG